MTRSRLFLAVAALAALYVISPIDAVPDVVPGVGWVDDALVGAATLLVGAIAKKRKKATGREA